jgi:hypothetical protein
MSMCHTAAATWTALAHSPAPERAYARVLQHAIHAAVFLNVQCVWANQPWRQAVPLSIAPTGQLQATHALVLVARASLGSRLQRVVVLGHGQWHLKAPANH